MKSSVKIEVSDATVKWIIGGACFIGICYLFCTVIEELGEDQIALPKEAKELASLPKISPDEFDQLGFHKEVKKNAEKSFYAGDYANSVRSAVVCLFDIVRFKSSIEADATQLIQKVFRGNNPILKFINVAQGHIQNPESGIVDMLEGFSKFIRKNHMHSNVELTKEKALQELSIICYLADLVENHTILSLMAV